MPPPVEKSIIRDVLKVVVPRAPKVAPLRSRTRFCAVPRLLSAENSVTPALSCRPGLDSSLLTPKLELFPLRRSVPAPSRTMRVLPERFAEISRSVAAEPSATVMLLENDPKVSLPEIVEVLAEACW